MLKRLYVNNYRCPLTMLMGPNGSGVNISPLQKAGIPAADILAGNAVEKAISDRSSWRDDERRWCREGKLPKLGWWDL